APAAMVGPGVWRMDVFPATEPLAGATQDLVRRIRAGPHAHPTLAGGLTAYLVDEKASLASRLPLALAIVALATLLVLFVMTGSALLPLKAVVMNVLTISATVGILVTVFQDGRFEGPLSYRSPGALDATQPILMAVLAFALATDYEVFLLSRIKEAHDAGLGTERAVAEGLQRTGRIVTAAAILFFVAVAAFATSRIVVVKELGLGTGLAVIIDATIVRALLVPALMALFGRWNWWAPAPLRRLHRRLVPAGSTR
ncbi:MAG TPA: MMPL family transporter, partial [Miltoncostaeaceae bacterium]|nr:MMPL family transporter [Miltoncostaeaceae bacterium]